VVRATTLWVRTEDMEETLRAYSCGILNRLTSKALVSWMTLIGFPPSQKDVILIGVNHIARISAGQPRIRCRDARWKKGVACKQSGSTV
jgi:hypothetical protein